jgi:hypothetical protein
LHFSADFTEREKEKSRLEKAFKDSDEKLEKLVSGKDLDLPPSHSENPGKALEF